MRAECFPSNGHHGRAGKAGAAPGCSCRPVDMREAPPGMFCGRSQFVQVHDMAFTILRAFAKWRARGVLEIVFGMGCASYRQVVARSTAPGCFQRWP